MPRARSGPCRRAAPRFPQEFVCRHKAQFNFDLPGAFHVELADPQFAITVFCAAASRSGPPGLALIVPGSDPDDGSHFHDSIPHDRGVSVAAEGYFWPVRLKQRVDVSLSAVRRYGRFVVNGNANLGRCLVCDHPTLFVVTGPWLANDYLCIRCGSMPRWRAMMFVLDRRFPRWRDLQMHECGAGGLTTAKFRRESSGGYSGSRYLVHEIPRGESIGNDMSCQDIERLTFPDASFDLFITQDVLEHVLRPDRAMAEIARVLRPGGAHVYTVPIVHGRRTLVRAVPSESGIEYLLPPEYHGGLRDLERSLVVREWGDDFGHFVSMNGGLSTEFVRLEDRRLGLDGSPGHPLEVLISRKES